MTWTEQLLTRVGVSRPGSARTAARLHLAAWLADADPHRGAAMAAEILDEVLERTGSRREHPDLTARAYLVRGHARTNTYDSRAAYADLEEADRRGSARADEWLTAWTLLLRGVCLDQLGDPGGVAVLVEDALERFTRLDDPIGQSRAMTVAGTAHRAFGRYREAAATLQRALALAEQTGDPAALGLALLHIGELSMARGLGLRAQGREDDAATKLTEALVQFDRTLRHARRTGFTALEPRVRAFRGSLCVHLGRAEEGRGEGEEALRLAHTLRDPAAEAAARYCVGLALRTLGAPAPAVDMLRQAEELTVHNGHAADRVLVVEQLVSAEEAMGDLSAALASHRRLLALSLKLREQSGLRDSQVLAARLEAQRARATAERERRRSSELEMANRRLEDETEELARLAHTDPLTGLANRRYFDAMLLRRLLQAELSGAPLTLALIDLDHFKSVNDLYTHPVGDEVLRRLARELSRHFSGADLAARIGGEEFAVLLPGADLGAGHVAADELRRAVARIDLRDLAPELAITVSIGLANSAPGMEPGTLLAQADVALYAAKHAGRNTVRPMVIGEASTTVGGTTGSRLDGVTASAAR